MLHRQLWSASPKTIRKIRRLASFFISFFTCFALATPYYNQAVFFKRPTVGSQIVGSGVTDAFVQYSGLQRKLVFVNNNWYAFYNSAGKVYYRKASSTGVGKPTSNPWSASVDIDNGDSDNYNPSVWVQGNLIYVAWIDDSIDGIEVRTINTSAADTLGTICSSGSQGTMGSTQTVSITAANNGTVYLAHSDTGAGTAFGVLKLTYGTCSFTSIQAASNTININEEWNGGDHGIVGCYQNMAEYGFGKGPIGTGYRGASRYSLASLPSNATVTDVKYRINILSHGDCNFSGGGSNMSGNVQAYNQDGQADPEPDATSSCTSNFRTRVRNDASPYISNDLTTFDTTGIKNIQLPAGANTDVQSAKAAVNRFSISISEGTSQVNNAWACLEGLPYGGSDPTRLVVTYTTPSGLTAGDRPVIVAIGNDIHMIFQDGNLSHSVFNGTDWTTSNATIAAVTDSSYSVTTDGSSLWALAISGTTSTDFYGCTSCANTSPSWSTLTSPFTGATNLNSVSLTYRENGVLDALVIKDATERVYFRSTPKSSISWGTTKYVPVPAGDYGHIFTPLSLSAAKGTGGVMYRYTTVLAFSEY